MNDGSDERLTHLDERGAARMVDVGDKEIAERRAEARCVVRVKADTLDLIRRSGAAKGDVVGVARVAGIMAAKRTQELIPLCHQVPLSQVTVDFDLIDDPPSVQVRTTARTESRTGVEMEAMTAAAVAALTIYDMCKAVDRGIVIDGLRLTFKSGGKSGLYRAE